MNKSMVYLLSGVGGIIGAYLPVLLFKVDGVSIVSIIGALIGGIAGIYLAVKISN